MEQTMSQSRFAVLITLTVVGLTAGLSRAQAALETVDLSTDSQEMRLANDPTLFQSFMGQSLVIAQSTAQKQSAKDGANPVNQPEKSKVNQIQTSTSDSMDHYQCVEHCAVVRQSCEGLATIQPDAKIATIGSEENNRWSRECHNIYRDCIDECSFDENNVHWKRANLPKNKKQEKMRISR
jgi:hypothetical protein